MKCLILTYKHTQRQSLLQPMINNTPTTTIATPTNLPTPTATTNLQKQLDSKEQLIPISQQPHNTIPSGVQSTTAHQQHTHQHYQQQQHHHHHHCHPHRHNKRVGQNRQNSVSSRHGSFKLHKVRLSLPRTITLVGTSLHSNPPNHRRIPINHPDLNFRIRRGTDVDQRTPNWLNLFLCVMCSSFSCLKRASSSQARCARKANWSHWNWRHWNLMTRRLSRQLRQRHRTPRTLRWVTMGHSPTGIVRIQSWMTR